MQGIGLSVMLIGLQMAIAAENIMLITQSINWYYHSWVLLIGNKGFDLGKWLSSTLAISINRDRISIFNTASLIFVISAMSIMGALDSDIEEIMKF